MSDTDALNAARTADDTARARYATAARDVDRTRAAAALIALVADAALIIVLGEDTVIYLPESETK